MKNIFYAIFLILVLAVFVFAQVPAAIHIQILKAEDARRYDKTLEDLFKHPHYDVRTRVALAAGRIGDERAIPSLILLLEKGTEKEREMAAFALGEIESINGADAIMKALRDANILDSVCARAVEAAGKISAANPKDEKSKAFGKAISDTLNAEDRKGAKQNRETVILGLTAILRTKPDGGDVVAAKFLLHSDPRIRADAANTLSRLRAKNANVVLRQMLTTDTDPIARANAARALGSAEDKEAFDILLNAATKDFDSRVRVSAIRSLAAFKDARAVESLHAATGPLLVELKTRRSGQLSTKSELLEIASALGIILENTSDERAVRFLSALRLADNYSSPETEIAFARIAPRMYVELPMFNVPQDSGFGYGFFNAAGVVAYLWQYSRALGSIAQGHGAIADNKGADQGTLEKSREYMSLLMNGVPAAIVLSNPEALAQTTKKPTDRSSAEMRETAEQLEKFKKYALNGFPDVMRAYAKHKPERYEGRIAEFLLNKPVVVWTTNDGRKIPGVVDASEQERREDELDLLKKDPVVRATAAELVSEIKDFEWGAVLSDAYDYAAVTDSQMNDAQLAILDAVIKQKGVSVNKVLEKALASRDAIIRQKAFNLIRQNDELKNVVRVTDTKIAEVKVYSGGATKNGQILNADLDYQRALSRKNGSVRAVFISQRGSFTIDLLPEEAPLTVDNFIKLARSNYFNGLEVHRVVPNFVMQDGDPRGDGNGGPGWSIRCEINMVPFERGAVGMALSGKDTGGSQWFVTHSPQPHLDGGYTVFGRVNETGMKVVDNIVRGDKIISVKIIEGSSPQRRGVADKRQLRK